MAGLRGWFDEHDAALKSLLAAGLGQREGSGSPPLPRAGRGWEH
jgi:hypothetical protein